MQASISAKFRSLVVLACQHEQQALGPLRISRRMRRLGRPQEQRLLLLRNAQGGG